MNNPKTNRTLAIFCWGGTALCTFLLFWLLRLAGRYPELASYTNSSRLVGVLLLLWLAASVWFTALARGGGSGEKDGLKRKQ